MQYAVHSTSHQKKRELQPIYFPPKNVQLPANVVIYILFFSGLSSVPILKEKDSLILGILLCKSTFEVNNGNTFPFLCHVCYFLRE